MTAPLFVPLDGRITSLPLLSGTLTGGEVQEIVSPGNAQNGNNYQITTAALAFFYSAYPYFNTTLILTGATLSSPFDATPATTRVLFNKVTGSPSYIVFPPAATMAAPYPILIKDLKGDAATNNITINFSNGEECDGLPELVIENAYGWVTIAPNPLGLAWYICG